MGTRSRLAKKTLDSHVVNYSEFTQDLLEDDDHRRMERHNTVLILHQKETGLDSIPDVKPVGESKLEIQTGYFQTHSDKTDRNVIGSRGRSDMTVETLSKSKEDKALHEPIIGRRVYNKLIF